MPENPAMPATDTLWVHRDHGLDSAPDDAPAPSWLQNARLLGQWHCPATSLSSALEVALSDLAGETVPPGLFPWGAFGAQMQGLTGQHWAELHLCHWHVSNGQVSLLPPDWPAPDVLERLWQELAAFVASDGLQLTPAPGGHAWVSGECLRDLPTAALDQVMGRPVADFLPSSNRLKRLQNELQMWFYTHPALQGFGRPINSVWFCGTGPLTPGVKELLQQLAWTEGATPAAGSRLLWVRDTHAGLWRIEGASLKQRLWRRLRPLTWPSPPHDLD